MKGFIQMVAYGFAVALGYLGGVKLWDEVLEDKVDDIRERLSKKN